MYPKKQRRGKETGRKGWRDKNNNNLKLQFCFHDSLQDFKIFTFKVLLKEKT
jgi:hypothetical protein